MPKKFRPTHLPPSPPSRAFLVEKFHRELWDSMVHLHGTAIEEIDGPDGKELSNLDKTLIRKFGQYKNDPTRGNFRSRGQAIETVEEECEVTLFTP